MKGLAPLFLGIFGTFAFSWVGLTLIPNWQIGHLNPQSDEEGTDIYPMPQSGMVTRGARAPKEEESPSPTGGASPAPQGAAASPSAVASAKAASSPPATSPSPATA